MVVLYFINALNRVCEQQAADIHDAMFWGNKYIQHYGYRVAIHPLENATAGWIMPTRLDRPAIVWDYVSEDKVPDAIRAYRLITH